MYDEDLDLMSRERKKHSSLILLNEIEFFEKDFQNHLTTNIKLLVGYFSPISINLSEKISEYIVEKGNKGFNDIISDFFSNIESYRDEEYFIEKYLKRSQL